MALTDEAVKSAETILSKLGEDMRFAPAIIEGDSRFDVLPVGWKLGNIRSVKAAKLWRAEGRQTLVMHPEVVRACRFASSSKIHLEVLRSIPYINPMVVFAEPIELPTWRNVENTQGKLFDYEGREKSLRLIGFLCYSSNSVTSLNSLAGKRENQITKRQLSDILEATANSMGLTNDPDAERFSCLVVCEVLDERGRVMDIDVASFSMDYGDISTIADLVEDQVQRFNFAGSGTNPVKERIYITECYKAVIGSLMYLASTVLDAEKVPASVTKHLAKRTIARKPLSLFRVGWTVGAALTRFRQERRRENPSQMGDIRHQQDPQHRKAHVKTVWTGPGRSIPKTAFVFPYWTHRERLGLSGINTVRRVPKTG